MCYVNGLRLLIGVGACVTFKLKHLVTFVLFYSRCCQGSIDFFRKVGEEPTFYLTDFIRFLFMLQS